MRVIVIGGGAIGLCVAEALAVRGCEVTVFERDRCGAGASAGNAGWISPSLSLPVPGPGVISDLVRSLVNPSAPLWIRPTLSPATLGSIARFLAYCRRSAHRRALAALQRAATLAGPAFDRLAERGVQLELHDDPLLCPAFDGEELEHLGRVVDELRMAGSGQRLEWLSPVEVRSLEPALDERVIGGLIAYGEKRVRPERLLAGLHHALVSRGAEVLERSPVGALRRDRSQWVAESATTIRRGDAVVIASGVASAPLLARLGMSLPMLAAKGYSRTYQADPSGPRRAVYLAGSTVAISVFDEGVRAAGTLELGAHRLTLSARRLAAISAAAQRALPGWRMPPQPRDWTGLRPLSPDGLPYIGAVPGLAGLHVASAHATLGITLAPATGELLAQLLLDRAPSDVLRPFDPARALRRRRLAGRGAIGHRQPVDTIRNTPRMNG